MDRYFGDGTEGYFISLMLLCCLGSVDDGTKGLLLPNFLRVFSSGSKLERDVCLFICFFWFYLLIHQRNPYES